MADTNTIQRPYKCTVQLALPSNQYAQHLKDVISVDQEISNKVVKTFSIVSAAPSEKDEGDGSGDMRVLQM